MSKGVPVGSHRAASRLVRLAATVALSACFVAGGVQTAGAVALKDTSARTPAEVRARWASAKPRFAGSTIFVTRPNTSAPYSVGLLQPGYVNDALNRANFARWLVGLPDDLTLDPTYMDLTQHAAVLLSATGQFTHHPAKPADMSQEFFDLGYKGTSSSNLAWAARDLSHSVQMYLDDHDSTNIAHVGHRRWVLSPSMSKTGFGEHGSKSAMYAFDSSRVDEVVWDHIAWPSAGAFPLEFFSDDHRLATFGYIEYGRPWSIQLNGMLYDIDPAGVVVSLTRVSDGKSWTFNADDRPYEGKKWGAEYLNVDGMTIIFRPDTTMVYKSGEAFDVRVGGTVYAKDTTNPVEIKYRTTFCKLTLPHASVGKPAAPKRVRRAKKFAVSGTLKPQHAAGNGVVRIYKDRKRAGKWVSQGYADARLSNYKTYSRYKVSLKLGTKGSWRIRACALADSKHSKSWSKYSYVTVR